MGTSAYPKDGTDEKHDTGNRRWAPLLILAGAGLPWILYDFLIDSPSDFWTYRGAIFIGIAVLGALCVVLAWHWSHGHEG